MHARNRWFSTLGKQICPGLDANEIQIPCDRHHMINMYKRFALFMMKAEEFKRDFRLPEPIFFWLTTRLQHVTAHVTCYTTVYCYHQEYLFTATDFQDKIDKWFSCCHSKSTLTATPRPRNPRNPDPHPPTHPPTPGQGGDFTWHRYKSKQTPTLLGHIDW